MQSPPPLCKYFTWIDHEVPEDVQKDQYQDCLRRQRLFEERFRRGLEEERRQKERMKRKQHEEERARQAKLAREEERMITHKYRGSQQFSRVEYSTQIY